MVSWKEKDRVSLTCLTGRLGRGTNKMDEWRGQEKQYLNLINQNFFDSNHNCQANIPSSSGDLSLQLASQHER